ncbi:MAG: hypothetical protein HZA22_06635 [Nitrospirae bacterium]|nr:hypothetical protein [Nitrospirota bacterium]
MQTEKKRVLITVKAYPNPSKKYKETVCCAGIDLSTGEWIRLYPIRFRYLTPQQQFKKYSTIEVLCSRPSNDKRPESYRVDEHSIRILDYLDTKSDKKWVKRKEIVFPTISPSFCQIIRDSEASDKSLGIFRPTDVSFAWEKITVDKENSDDDAEIQRSFFDEDKGTVEKLPFRFYYEFRCKGEAGCQGHKLSIIDWELGQAYRFWKLRYKDTDVLLEKIKEKWLGEICSEKRDYSFIVGNIHWLKRTFMILGTFWPPKED